MKRTLRQIFVENLKYYRTKKGLSQQVLAVKLDKSYNYINGIENNNTFPSVETIEQIAQILSIRPSQLFEEKGCPENTIQFDSHAFAKEITENLYERIHANMLNDIEAVLGKR